MEQLTIFFSGSKEIEKYAKELPDPKIGCTTAGEIHHGLTKGMTKLELPGQFFNYYVVKVEDTKVPITKANEIKKGIETVKKGKRNLVCLVMNDGLSGHEEIMQTTLKALLPKGTPIIGGSTGDDLNFLNTYCCIDQEVFKGSVILLLGTNLSYTIHKENIYQPTDKSVIVTKADDRTVYTFDNIKASKRYAEILGVDERELSKYFSDNPLGKINGEEVYISSPQKVNPDGSITFYCKMLPSTFLKLLAPVDIRNELNKTAKAILSQGKPLVTMTSNCILRKLKFEKDHIEPQVNEVLKKINAVGFTTYGEQLDGLHINQTMVTLTFFEG